MSWKLINSKSAISILSFRKEVIYFLGLIFLIFLLIYDINFTFLPYLTTGRFVVFVLFLFFLLKVSLNYLLLYGCFIFLLILGYSFVQTGFSGDATQSLRIFWFFIYGWIAPHLLEKKIANKQKVYLAIYIAVTLQAIIAINVFFNVELKKIVLELIQIPTNITEEESSQRAFGFTSLSGASLSVVQSLGFFAGIFYLNKNIKLPFFVKSLIWIGLLIILISNLLIGRTGLIISLFCIGYYFLFNINIKNKVIIIVVSFFLFYYVDITRYFENATETVAGFHSDWFIVWIEEAFTIKNNSTFQELNKMNIPSLSFETVIGTGRVVAETGIGNASGNDSGYIQTYYSLGLIASFLFYGNYLGLCIYQWIMSKREPMIFLLLLITFFVEYKEPFIFKFSLPFILSTFLVYEAKYKED